LLEEAGEEPDPDEFCQRYPMWKDSLEVQLNCHRELSKLARSVRAAPPLPKAGEIWNGFQLSSILGRGGTSTVFLAYEDAMGGRPVALKISPDRGSEPAILGWLDHPRIMPAFSVCRDSMRGLRGLCMPYRTGAPLNALLRGRWTLKGSQGASVFLPASDSKPFGSDAPTPDCAGWQGFPWTGGYDDGAAWVLSVLTQAVSYIHSKGVIHCDIKPSNIYLSVRDGPLLFDFGFARTKSAGNPLSGGTLAYMSPEQLRAFVDTSCWCEVGPASDIYALGLVLVELLLGTPPDAPSSSLPPQLAARRLLSTRSTTGWFRTLTYCQIPKHFQTIIERCLTPNPEARYTQASTLADDLEDRIGQRTRRACSFQRAVPQSCSAPKPSSPAQAHDRRRRRSPIRRSRSFSKSDHAAPCPHRTRLKTAQEQMKFDEDTNDPTNNRGLRVANGNYAGLPSARLTRGVSASASSRHPRA
jgi:serine/threonine protein kinase